MPPRVLGRRSFLKGAGAAVTGAMLGGAGFTASSYARIIGANDRLMVGVRLKVGGQTFEKESLAAFFVGEIAPWFVSSRTNAFWRNSSPSPMPFGSASPRAACHLRAASSR